MTTVLYGSLASGIGLTLLIVAISRRNESSLAAPVVGVTLSYLVNIAAETGIGVVIVVTGPDTAPPPAEFFLQVVSFVSIYSLAACMSWLTATLLGVRRRNRLLAIQLIVEVVLFLALVAALFVPEARLGPNPVLLLLDLPVSLLVLVWIVQGLRHFVPLAHSRIRSIFIVSSVAVPLALVNDLLALPVRLGIIDRPILLSPLLFSCIGIAALVADRPSRGSIAYATIEANLNGDRFGLSTRECEVARHLLTGQTYAEIGSLLSIAPATVKTHVLRIYRKAGVRNKLELVRAIAAHSDKEG